MSLLTKNANANYVEEGEEAFVYCIRDNPEDEDNIIFLNKTGRVIWNLCDGTRSAEDIVEMFSEKFTTVSKETLQKEIGEFIGQLVDKGLLTC